MSQLTIVDQWAGWFQAGTSDKVWAACYTADGRYLAVWGRRGTHYQTQQKVFGTGPGQHYAHNLFHTKINEKLGKGYHPVAFNDSRYGNIPSFLAGAKLAPAEQLSNRDRAGVLTVAAILARARAFVARIRAARDDHALAGCVMEWKQITGLAEVFLTIPTLAAPETEGLRGVLREMESLVLVGLSA